MLRIGRAPKGQPIAAQGKEHALAGDAALGLLPNASDEPCKGELRPFDKQIAVRRLERPFRAWILGGC